jgi:hypothetical protein
MTSTCFYITPHTNDILIQSFLIQKFETLNSVNLLTESNNFGVALSRIDVCVSFLTCINYQGESPRIGRG